MIPILFSLFTPKTVLDSFIENYPCELGRVNFRSFPDGESYVQLITDVKGREVIIFDSLNRPNDKIMPLIFLAQTARELGATRVGLISPYLAYMRQDKRFHPGECITSVYFSRLLSQTVDWLMTMDPHLHRYHALSEIYDIPTRLVHARERVSDWCKTHLITPLFIGPDEESEQWVSEIAKELQAPYLILKKERLGDSDVSVSLPSITGVQHRTPVLLDDIISTAQTMIMTVNVLRSVNMPPPICIGVHAVFAENSYESLLKAGVSRVLTCNTIVHPSNEIDVMCTLAESLSQWEAL